MRRRSKSGGLLLAIAAAGCAPGGEPPPEARAAEVPAATGAAPAPASASAWASASASASASVSASASSPAPGSGDRIYAKARFVWIQPAPRPSKGWIGYLTLGGSVRLHRGSAAEAKALGPGCDAWYRVEPTGYVCLGPETTLDPDDPVLLHLARHAPKVGDPLPFAYGESVGAPRYFGLPSDAEQRKVEWDLDRHRARLAAGEIPGVDPSPAGVGVPALPALGPLVREGRSYVAPGSTIAWSAAWDAGGRTWLYTSDHVFVPKDRVKPYARSTFRGVALEGDVTLPIAFFRKKDRPKYARAGGGFEATGETFPRLGHVLLTGREETAGKEAYLETKEPGVWVRASDASVAAVRKTIPFLGGDRAASERRTWVDVSILAGTLVAYEGERPVYATLVSPGRGGLPVPGHDPLETASTPTGTFRVDGKFRTATMVSSTDANVVHADVQFVQNFHGPHALHGAYWHDAWGEPKSGGCVNLSPVDSKWLFDWTEPRVPDDWHGARSVEALGASTRVVVRP